MGWGGAWGGQAADHVGSAQGTKELPQSQVHTGPLPDLRTFRSQVPGLSQWFSDSGKFQFILPRSGSQSLASSREVNP